MREWFAVVVKLLLTRSVCCLVYGQRKDSCDVGVSTTPFLMCDSALHSEAALYLFLSPTVV